MKIKELSCEQFAGIKGCNVLFEDGMNILVGPNETGKSSLVDLLYHLFFQDTKLDARKDKDFKENYFPKTTGIYHGDAVDGTVRFETDNGEYRLSKEWMGRTGTCRLSLPNKTVLRSEEEVRNAIRRELVYGKGIFDELAFASQRREQNALKGLLSSEKPDSVKELSALVTKAVMETGGIAIEKVEEELNSIIAGFEGHWDFSADQPEGGRRRGINNQWRKEVGSILNAYYTMEELRAKKEETEDVERQIEENTGELQQEKITRARAQKLSEEFSRIRAQIENRRTLENLTEKEEEEKREKINASRDWPVAEKKYAEAKTLQAALTGAEKRELYRKIMTEKQNITEAGKKLEATGEISEADLKAAEEIQRKLNVLEAKLSGLNLTAKIRQLGTEEVSVTSLNTGDVLSVSNGELAITEAVAICVPGVVDIQLMPKGINLDSIQAELIESREILCKLFEKHHVSTVEELHSKHADMEIDRRNIEASEDKIHILLNDFEWDTLKTEVEALAPQNRTISEIKAEISALCDDTSLDAFIGEKFSEIRYFAGKYESKEWLEIQIKELGEKLAQHLQQLSETEAIPEEFADIIDPEKYASDLLQKINLCNDHIDALTSRKSSLEAGITKSSEDFEEELQDKIRLFEEQKEECLHWLNIKKVFTAVKEKMKGNPMEDIERTFGEYLSIISDNGITLEEISENMQSTIISADHPLTFDILSEGTKDTISLAFRLAVLEHLYPDGNSVAVFDDPFTDMDPKRTQQACALLQKFAEKNQVIFVTCDDKYLGMLKGNVIPFAR